MKRGDIVQLGRHRLMCGDATSREDTDKLLAGHLPSLIFTSPPYLQQRNYGTPAGCWTSMMTAALAGLPLDIDAQILVNLGLIYRQGQWLEYWQPWLAAMQAYGWKKFGWYIWDKKESLPGARHGRLAPSFEFVFHLNKKNKEANKIIKCVSAGETYQVLSPGFLAGSWRSKPTYTTGTHRIADATMRLLPDKSGKLTGKHPAKFPASLPLLIHGSWTQENDVVYDPFSGSGTSLIAAEMGRRVSVNMEISSEYCDVSIERYRKHIEKTFASGKPKRKVVVI